MCKEFRREVIVVDMVASGVVVEVVKAAVRVRLSDRVANRVSIT